MVRHYWLRHAGQEEEDVGGDEERDGREFEGIHHIVVFLVNDMII